MILKLHKIAMKKNKLKSLVKSARRFTKKEIVKSLTEQISGSLLSYNLDSKKVKKEVTKAAKKLANKLSSEIKVDKKELRKNQSIVKVGDDSAASADLVPAVSENEVSAREAGTPSKGEKPKSPVASPAVNAEIASEEPVK